MKIVYCTKNISNNGGTERVLANKANYLVKLGYEISIVSVDTVEQEPFFKFDPAIKFYTLECGDFFKYHGIKKKLEFNKNKKIFHDRMSKLLYEIKPDITISLFDKYSRYIYKINDGSKKILERHFAKHKRAQYLSKLENYPLGRYLTYRYRRKEYGVIRHFDKYVVLTEEDRNDWGNLPNISVIPNALTFLPSVKSDTQAKRIIAIGRISKQKQFDILVEIWSKIACKYLDWKLMIYGSGDRERLKNYANTLGIKGNVEINPPIQEVEKVLVDSSIYAMTSKYEGLPMVLLEAMSCGLPVIAFSCKCGPRDIIKDKEDGFLVKPGDQDMFIDKLSLLIEDRQLRARMGKAAAKNIIRFSEDIVMKKWIDLFDELVKQN